MHTVKTRRRILPALIDITFHIACVITRSCTECGGKRQHAEGCPHAPRHFTAAH